MAIVNIDTKGIGGVFEGLGNMATSLRSAITGDLPPAMKTRLEALTLETESLLIRGQHEINNTEAKHTSIFVSGWRPFIGWVCGIGLLYHYILNRLIEWVVLIYKPEMVLPTFELGDLMVILGGLLGLGGLRTIEKKSGVNNKH